MINYETKLSECHFETANIVTNIHINFREVCKKRSGMGTSQKYSLRWNDFSLNVATTFRDLHSRQVSLHLHLAFNHPKGRMQFTDKWPSSTPPSVTHTYIRQHTLCTRSTRLAWHQVLLRTYASSHGKSYSYRNDFLS